MPEIFLEFIGDASPWLVPLLVVLAVWGKLNWDALNNPAKKASFDRAMGWLREDSFGQLYLGFLGGLMDRVGDWIGDRQQLSQDSMAVTQPKGLVGRVFGFNPFTVKSYEKCLYLAFMYPMLAYLLAWAMGAEGHVGGADLFGSSDIKLSLWQRWSLIGSIVLFMAASLWFVLRWRGWKQWLALSALLLLVITNKYYLSMSKDNIAEYFLIFIMIPLLSFLLLYLGGLLTGLLIYRSFQTAHQGIYKLALIFSVTLTLAFATALNFTVVIVGAKASAASTAIAIAAAAIVAIAATVSNTFAGTIIAGVIVGAIAINANIGAIFIAGIAIVLLQAFQKWGERISACWFWLVYSILLIAFGTVSLAINANSNIMLLVLLWLLLPLVNAPLDWLSLGATRGLLQAVRAGTHSGWRTLIWAGTDLLLAFTFLFLITAVLVGVTALGNAIAGKTLIDIGCIISKVQTDRSDPDHWWIYFMLLSTLIPTLFHFALAGGAATLWLPRKWRTQLADGLEDDMHKTFGAWVYLTFTPVVGFILMPLGLLWSLWWLLNANGGKLGTLLLSWAEGLAKWADPSMALVCGAGG